MEFQILAQEQEEQVLGLDVQGYEETGFLYPRQHWNLLARTNLRTQKVERTYSDFEFLRDSLLHCCAGLKVPSLPPKDLKLRLPLTPKGSLLRLRQFWLKSFLALVLAHPGLQGSCFLLNFATLGNSQFQTFKDLSIRTRQQLSLFVPEEQVVAGLQQLHSIMRLVAQVRTKFEAAFLQVSELHDHVGRNLIPFNDRFEKHGREYALMFEGEWLRLCTIWGDLDQHLSQARRVPVGGLESFLQNWNSDFQSEVARVRTSLQEGSRVFYQNLARFNLRFRKVD